MTPAPELPPRWYLTPAGRVVRALLGLPLAALAVLLFRSAGPIAIAGGVLLAYASITLPWAAVVQEPD